MKSFFWRILICVVPVALGTWVTIDAAVNNKFKFGVDLSGGTILVYEIDTRKLEEKKKEEEAKTKGAQTEGVTSVDYFKRTASELSEALKRRIDPTATYNIIVRPAGSEGRVEIILPTGGAKEAKEAENAWQELLKKVAKDTKVDVPRGQVELLVERIQEKQSADVWRNKLLNSEEAWDRLLKKLDDPDVGWQYLTQKAPIQAVEVADAVALGFAPGGINAVTIAGVAQSGFLSGEAPIKSLRRIPPGDTNTLSVKLFDALEDEPKGKIDSWIKQRAWEELIHRIVSWPELTDSVEAKLKKQYKGKELTKKQEEELQKDLAAELKNLETELNQIPADSIRELIGRIESGGNVLSQAVLDAVEPLLGRVTSAPSLMKRDKIEEFVTAHYGPSEFTIRETIDEVMENDPRLKESAKNLTLEKVQTIKDLVAKVGALEFRILANEVDDKAAEKQAADFINRASSDPAVQEELEKAAINGLPPPGPRDPGSKELKKFDIKLPRGYKSQVTYSWVELGKQERKQLGFNNKSRTSPYELKREIWDFMNANRGRAVQVTYPRKKTKLWQGALFYSREVKDRNLPEKERRKKKYEYFVLARNPEYDTRTGEQTPAIDGRYLARAYEDLRSGRPQVGFNFYPEGGNLFGALTRKNVPSGEGGEESKVKRHLAIILDGLIMSAPTLNSEIRDSGVITGDFTRREVEGLVNILRSGALPATLKPEPVSESTIGALLGQDTIEAGKWAIIISFTCVLIFMIIYYRFAGVVACIALFANLALTVGFMVAVQATFTLPGLAGLVLMLGVVVDANVLIFERIREERDRGASLQLAIRNGYERAFPTIIDTHLSSIFTAVVLYAVGNDQLKGFAITLTVGLIFGLFTALFITRTLFDFWQSRGLLHKLSMFRLMSSTHINFMGARHVLFTASVAFTIGGLALFLARIPRDLDIDFKGGTAFSAQLTEAINIEGLRDRLDENNQKALLVVDKVEQIDDEGREFRITYKPKGTTEKQSYTVFLANRPDGNSKSEWIADVKRRAGFLDDTSVEILYPSKELKKLEKELTEAKQKLGSEYVSPFFTVRTSEKERELVAVLLNQILQEKGDSSGSLNSMLKKVNMRPPDTSQLAGKKRTAKLTFDDPASPSFVKNLLDRELRRVFEIDKATKKLDVQFQITGEGTSDESGRFSSMVIAFEGVQKGQAEKIQEALIRMREAFNQRPQPLRLENFDSELAADTRFRALGAIVASWLAIVLYLWFRFGNWTFGLAAVLCLVHDLCFTLGLVALSAYIQPTFIGKVLMIEDFKIDLTAVAALLTLVGYSVNDTIVVFDRIREVRGKNPELTPDIINVSVNQTLSRTVITSLTTLAVVAVLYAIGGPGIHLFAFIFIVGIVIGTFSSIFIACPLLLILGEGKITEKERARKRETAPATV